MNPQDTLHLAKFRNRRWMAKQRGSDSIWEADLRDGPLSNCCFKPDKVSYIVEHKYTPDFSSSCGKYLIETKGRFRDSAEASKYKWIRESLPDGVELVFVFYNPNCRMPHARKRKDGSYNTHKEWAEKNGFRWFTSESIKELLNEEN